MDTSTRGKSPPAVREEKLSESYRRRFEWRAARRKPSDRAASDVRRRRKRSVLGRRSWPECPHRSWKQFPFSSTKLNIQLSRQRINTAKLSQTRRFCCDGASTRSAWSGARTQAMSPGVATKQLTALSWPKISASQPADEFLRYNSTLARFESGSELCGSSILWTVVAEFIATLSFGCLARP